MVQSLIRKSASIADLKRHAKRSIPGFAFDYVEGGCDSDNNMRKNRLALDEVFLRPDYFKSFNEPDLTTSLFGQTYSAPFGIAPVGLTGIIWPHAPIMLAKAAKKTNIPFVLSTVATSSIEDAGAAAEENFWYQLYPPADPAIRSDLLKRAAAVGCKNLVVTIDVPGPSRRPRDIRNGLAIPPKITAKNILQSAMRPKWALATLQAGLPEFASLKPYFKDIQNLEDTALFVRQTFRKATDEDMIKEIRDQWQGNLILKGVSHVEDAKQSLALGADGIIVSNHGGRQLDAAEASIDTLSDIVSAVGNDMVIMADSGVEGGVDIARFIAQGAKAVFAGRAFLYGVGAHQQEGANHAVDLLRDELFQVMTQMHCAEVAELQERLISR